MNKKYTYDDFYKRASAKGFEIISSKEEFKNTTTLMKYICPQHKDKGIQQTTLGRLLEGKGCYYCGLEKTRISKIKKISKDMIEEVKVLCEEKNFEFVSIDRIVKDNKSKICVSFICNNHRDKGVQTIPIGNFKRNKKCKYCIHKELSKNDIKKMIEQSSPQIEVLSDYKLLNDNIDYRCKIHNYFGHTSVTNLIKGTVCYYCGTKKLSEKATLSNFEVNKRIKEINPNFERISDYSYSTKPIKIKCSHCNYIWESSLVNLKYCPNCEKEKMYKGERIIFDILKNNNIKFEQQKKYDDCKNIRPLSFDFYLPEYNSCIEYNGIQHYKPIEHFGGEKSYKQQILNDEIKKEYCINNNITLIIIPYKLNTEKEISKYIFSKLA